MPVPFVMMMLMLAASDVPGVGAPVGKINLPPNTSVQDVSLPNNLSIDLAQKVEKPVPGDKEAPLLRIDDMYNKSTEVYNSKGPISFGACPAGTTLKYAPSADRHIGVLAGSKGGVMLRFTFTDPSGLFNITVQAPDGEIVSKNLERKEVSHGSLGTGNYGLFLKRSSGDDGYAKNVYTIKLKPGKSRDYWVYATDGAKNWTNLLNITIGETSAMCK